MSPGSWVREFAVVAILLDKNLRPIPDSASDTKNRVMGDLQFSAPYLPGPPLRAVIETNSQQVVRIAVPFPPSASGTELKLTAYAFRDKAQPSLLVRHIAIDESLVMLKVYQDGKIEIFTNKTPAPELSIESDTRRQMERLYQGGL